MITYEYLDTFMVISTRGTLSKSDKINHFFLFYILPLIWLLGAKSLSLHTQKTKKKNYPDFKEDHNFSFNQYNQKEVHNFVYFHDVQVFH